MVGVGMLGGVMNVSKAALGREIEREKKRKREKERGREVGRGMAC